MTSPTFVVVSGPPGTGKTTLAHRIGAAIPCPVICRDEIKQGLVHADGGRAPVWGGAVSRLTHETFFSVLQVILGAGATVVAEAALQNDYWKPELEPLLRRARLRIVQCTVDASIARERIAHRAQEGGAKRAAHPDQQILEALDSGSMTFEQFEPITLLGQTLRVDTTDGYEPSLDRIVAFINNA